MKTKKIIKLLFILPILVLSIFLIPEKSKAEDSETTITWHKGDDLTFNDAVYIDPGMTLIIEKGAEIKLGQFAYISISGGRVIANGTVDEPIKITSDFPNTSLLMEFYYAKWDDIPDSEPSFLRYVEFSNGGYEQTPCLECSAFLQYIFPTAQAFSGGFPALYFGGGKLHIENCSFKDNTYADIGVEYWKENENSESYSLEVVNSNFLGDANSMAVKSDITCENPGMECMKKVLLKNNWYGNSQGPTEENNSSDKRKRIEGVYFLDGFRKNDLIADPVIVIPGITGSQPKTKFRDLETTWQLDPILHTYDNLVASFKKNGYVKDVNLFEFPYEWRNSNVITAGLLKQKISEIVGSTKVSKVDLVAHSMGGLVSRYYIQSEDYQDNIDQLITLGTPHKGSPKAYLKWEAAEGFFTLLDKASEIAFREEAIHYGYLNLKKYIQDKIISVKELLPDYDYLKEASDGEMRTYPNNYPQNDLLESLNNSLAVDNLRKVSFTNVIGKLDSENTISKFRVVKSPDEGKWEHGMPENFGDSGTDRGIEYGKGDETVPLSSAEWITADEKIEKNSSHNDLPTTAQCDVIKELTSKIDCEYVSTFDRIVSVLTFGILSPIDIQIIAPDGKRVGKDFETGEILDEIEGAYYTGYNTENEFLTIPNPIDGEYKILTQGTGEGDYKIEVAKITENEDSSEATESTKEILGTATIGQEEENNIEIENGEIVSEDKDTTPPTIAIESPEEEKIYSNNQEIDVQYQVEDDKSSVDKITSQFYWDNIVLEDEKIDLAFQKLGAHKFKVIATDEAGNNSEKEIVFSTTTDIDAIINNIEHYYQLKLLNRQDKTVITSRLRMIDGLQCLIEKMKKKRMPNWVEKRMVKVLEDRVNHHLELISDYVKKRSKLKFKMGIDKKVTELLIEDFNFIKY